MIDMKCNILIHIGSLNAGGAEKSLISFLSLIDPELYNVDLLLLKDEGVFRNLLPKHVKVTLPEFPYKCLAVSPKNMSFYLSHSPKFLFKKVYSLFRFIFRNLLSKDQIIWQIWKHDIGELDKQYDVAISYIEGIPNYYVIDKIKAQRKILWVHNEYSKLKYDKDFDKEYFEKADVVVTVSELCFQNLLSNFPSLKTRFCVLENITNPSLVRELADQCIQDDQFDDSYNGLILLSIGRLHPQKNYDLAIEAARIINDMGINFKWYIIGDGFLKDSLSKKIDELKLNDRVILLGIRENPYSYMKRSHIIIQSSLYEGKSIVIDEAKILHKPIVVTNYNTVYNVISDHINGLICEMTPESVAESIMELYNKPEVLKTITRNLVEENVNNVDEIHKYLDVIKGVLPIS